MSVMTAERPARQQPIQPPEPTVSERTPFDELRQTLDTLEVPDGYRAEIIGGNIVMSPWSKGFYLDIMESLAEQLKAHAPEGHRVSQAPFLYVFPKVGRAYGPDIHVADAAATRIRSVHLPGEALSLVAELTSEGTADFDREDKVEVYGKAGVPVYVLVDMLKDRVTVYSKPAEGGYQCLTQIPFGDTVRVPAPFDCDLDTSDWKS